jgi:hypothetical protein
MLWQAKVRQALPTLVWVCVVLAVAAYGAVVVRNVTDTLIGIVDHSRSVALVDRPNR